MTLILFARGKAFITLFPFVYVFPVYSLEVIYQTRGTVFHRDTQTPRRELKIRRAEDYF